MMISFLLNWVSFGNESRGQCPRDVTVMDKLIHVYSMIIGDRRYHYFRRWRVAGRCPPFGCYFCHLADRNQTDSLKNLTHRNILSKEIRSVSSLFTNMWAETWLPLNQTKSILRVARRIKAGTCGEYTIMISVGCHLLNNMGQWCVCRLLSIDPLVKKSKE